MSAHCRRRGNPALPLLALTLATAGCGGTKDLHVWLSLSESNRIPVYVGVYYLSRADALDDVENTKLIEEKEKNRDRNGVIEAQVQPVQPGTPLELSRQEDKRITHILIAANDRSRCARALVRVKDIKKHKLLVTIDDARCVKIMRSS